MRAGLKPMLCVGETEAEREAGNARDVVVGQLEAVLAEHAEGLAAVAYEPVWAIGTGRTATPEMAQEMHGVIRDVLKERSANEPGRQAAGALRRQRQRRECPVAVPGAGYRRGPGRRRLAPGG